MSASNFNVSGNYSSGYSVPSSGGGGGGMGIESANSGLIPNMVGSGNSVDSFSSNMDNLLGGAAVDYQSALNPPQQQQGGSGEPSSGGGFMDKIVGMVKAPFEWIGGLFGK